MKCEKCGSNEFIVNITGTQIYNSEFNSYYDIEVEGVEDTVVCRNCQEEYSYEEVRKKYKEESEE